MTIWKNSKDALPDKNNDYLILFYLDAMEGYMPLVAWWNGKFYNSLINGKEMNYPIYWSEIDFPPECQKMELEIKKESSRKLLKQVKKIVNSEKWTDS